MDPVTVKWNGPLHQEQAVESPDPALTAGEYLAELVAAHAIVGDGLELVVLPEGEPVPDDLDVGLLSGLTVLVRSEATVEEPAADVEASLGTLVDTDGNPIDLPDGGDPTTAEAQPIATEPTAEQGANE